ncbi:MAG: cation:proton antiporter [Blastocatellia bacterium]|nr:cation:proton antiporter [Blastocatellia bacterium]
MAVARMACFAASPNNIMALFLSGSGETVLFQLFVIFAAAKIAAEVCERLKQPAVVGEILAGIIIGPSLLNWVHTSEVLQTLSEIGVILLLFTVGLEVNPTALFKVGKLALGVAVSGVLVPFLAGWLLMRVIGAPFTESMFLGAALVATSVGITARVLGGMGVLAAQSSQIILGAAVIDDILGLMVLSVVSSLAKGSVNLAELALTGGLSVGFTLFVVLVGSKIAKKARPRIEKLRVNEAFFVVGMVLCLGLSWLSTVVGVAAIIGAFLAGMALSEVSEDTALHQQAGSVMEFSVPFFLVGIGMQLDLSVFRSPQVIGLAVGTTILAVITKLLACGAAALPLGKRAALQVGMGMVPRGEVGIIVAQIGLGLGVLPKELYAVVVFMAVATTLVAPPFLRRLYQPGKEKQSSDAEEVIESDQSFTDIG